MTLRQLIRILTVHTVKDLFRYRSFFMLIFLLFLLDRLIHWNPGTGFEMPSWRQAMASNDTLAVYVFNQLPGLLASLIVKWQVWLILAGLFLLKQLISMWPSSDMRRIHRNERRGFGIFTALFVLQWRQILWDAIAVISLCGAVGVWTVVWYQCMKWGWRAYPATGWMWVLGGMVFIATPLTLAGFSYSSKLAVMSHGSFGRKLVLFSRLFTDKRLFARSWSFYFLRQIIEVAFVAVLPALIMMTLPHPLLRILSAGVVATPVYSFLKMASFKFFLYAYSTAPEVRSEYSEYYRKVEIY